ncbi:MAG: hypothetical protein AB9856_18080 [Cellulosilyticaceae bacterium]
MKIENNIIKPFLKNVRFITGTAYAGKSTMVGVLAKTYDSIACGENYHAEVIWDELNPLKQPNLCYLKNIRDWQDFVNRTPQAYDEWIMGSAREAAEIEVAELIRISQNQKVIVDTNIPVDILKEIADYHQVAVMVSPQSLSVEKFFDREDPEKQFIKEQIMKSEDPEATMANYKACLARVNSKEHYDEYANSGFFTLVRRNATHNIVDEQLENLASHFQLSK